MAPSEPSGPPEAEVAAAVERVLSSAEHEWLRWPKLTDVAPLLRQLYEREPDRLLWFAGSTPLPSIDEALATFAAASEDGLDSEDYDGARLADRWQQLRAGTTSATDRALFDLAMSVGAARMIGAVHLGRVDPAMHAWGYDLTRKRLDLDAMLLAARRGQGLRAALAALAPPFAHYARARTALARYRELAAAGEPPPVPELPKGRRKVEPGQSWEGVDALAARLRVLGDLAAAGSAGGTGGVATPPAGVSGTAGVGAAAGTGPAYDAALVAAVKGFQARHGHDPDGVIGAGTIRALNVPLSRRIRQLELAMERMRWLPKLSDRPNVFANVALFRLWATDPASGAEPLRMRIVVGKSLQHATPIFLEQMEYVVLRPYWNPPPSIVRSEIVPAARRDPTYLERQQIEIVASGDDDAPALPATPENVDAVAAFRLHVRQRPGPHNALGLAKFMFPNADNIYMHGTPAQSLFARSRRDFSHGCIRLEDPLALAEWVLRDQPGWTRERIEAAMNGERPTHVRLKQPLDVVLFYDSVHVNSEGVVFFVDDIYGDDAKLDAALKKGYPYPVKTAAAASGPRRP